MEFDITKKRDYLVLSHASCTLLNWLRPHHTIFPHQLLRWDSIWHEWHAYLLVFFWKEVFLYKLRVKWHVGFVAAHEISGIVFVFLLLLTPIGQNPRYMSCMHGQKIGSHFDYVMAARSWLGAIWGSNLWKKTHVELLIKS